MTKNETFTTPVGTVKFPKTIIDNKEFPNIYIPENADDNLEGSWKFQLIFDPNTPQAKELLATLDEQHSKIKGSNFKPYKKDQSKNDDGALVETGLIAINFTSGFKPKMVDSQLVPCNVSLGWGSKIRVKFTTKPVNNKGKVGLGRYVKLIQVIEPATSDYDTDGFDKIDGFTTKQPTENMDYSD